MFSDPAVFDSLEDRDGDGLTDLEEFLLGTDPRAASTSGGIIDDGWLVKHGLDPLEVWDDVVYTNTLTYLDVYLHGWPFDPQNPVDYSAWLERGLEPGVDEWPEGEDAPGDVTLVSVRLLGDAAGYSMVS